LEALHAPRANLKMKFPKYITASDEETKILQMGKISIGSPDWTDSSLAGDFRNIQPFLILKYF
jgi:hypothetical protein